MKSSDLDDEVMKASLVHLALGLCNSPPNFQNLPAEFRFFVKNYIVLSKYLILTIYVL